MIDPLSVTAIGSALTGVGGIILGTDDDKAQAAKKAAESKKSTPSTKPKNEKEHDA